MIEVNVIYEQWFADARETFYLVVGSKSKVTGSFQALLIEYTVSNQGIQTICDFSLVQFLDSPNRNISA